MKVNILASGSGGNCIALTSGANTILIDAGIAKTKIEKALLEVGIRADQIKAIFITHAHGDHIKGLPIANKYRIPVYASEGEWKSIKKVDEELQKVMDLDTNYPIGDSFDVSCFNVHHDAISPLGYTVIGGGNKCSICLDTGKVTDDMLEAMKDSDIYIIEANHEPNLVEESDYPNSVKARILSHIGHLSNEQTAEALSKLIRGRNEQIYLTHMSHSNNMPSLAELTMVSELRRKGYKRDKDYRIEVI